MRMMRVKILKQSGKRGTQRGKRKLYRDREKDQRT